MTVTIKIIYALILLHTWNHKCTIVHYYCDDIDRADDDGDDIDDDDEDDVEDNDDINFDLDPLIVE